MKTGLIVLMAVLGFSFSPTSALAADKNSFDITDRSLTQIKLDHENWLEMNCQDFQASESAIEFAATQGSLEFDLEDLLDKLREIMGELEVKWEAVLEAIKDLFRWGDSEEGLKRFVTKGSCGNVSWEKFFWARKTKAGYRALELKIISDFR